MPIIEILYCNQDKLHLVKEEYISNENLTLSITENVDGSIESMIFLGKMEQDSGCYEVVIYKENSESDKYTQNKRDHVLAYKNEGEYDVFKFGNFNYAYEFIDSLYDNHPEYKNRPWRKVIR